MLFDSEVTKGTRGYTLLIVAPHGRSWKLRISKYILCALLSFSLMGAITFAALANSYVRMLLKVSNYNDLRADRQALKTKYTVLENVVNHTDTQLSSLESLASEVAISYGIGKQPRAPFPRVTLAAVLPGGAQMGSRYDASLYTFNMIEQASSIPGRSSVLLGLISNPLVRSSSIPSLWPVRGEVTDSFGERIDPISGDEAFHPGIDIAAPPGTPVRATADGIVVQAGLGEAGYGNEVLIDHGSGLETRYGHLRKVFVVDGQEVKQGQIIGSVGMTGRATGPHLHYEVLVRNTPVNPAKFLHG
ncbi:MAG: M23 family metallopeptidase [Terriglobia bacterium]